MNLETLAKLAEVSVGTVSKAFSGSKEISEDTKERIFALAKEHGCFDKYNKNRFDKKVIAVICPELNSEYYSATVTLLNREITLRGGIMSVSTTDFSVEREEALFSYYASYCKADGILTINQSAALDNSFHVPAVAILPTNTAMKSKNIDFILSDMPCAIEQAIEYLKSLGHKQIAFAGEKLTMAKLKNFKDAMRKAGLVIEERLIAVSPKRFEEAGEEIMDKWLAEGGAPRAVVAAYDYIAIGLIKSLRRAGKQVPRDCSVVGMDDISIVPYLDVPLSSIHTHTDDACRTAVEILLKKAENQYYSSRQKIVMPSEFVARGSCAPLE